MTETPVEKLIKALARQQKFLDAVKRDAKALRAAKLTEQGKTPTTSTEPTTPKGTGST